MIEQELLILGLLKENPKHGYELKKEILALFAGIDAQSIYYPLKIMEKQGLVVKKAAKEGRRPQRFVYHLTPKGEGKFQELLTSSFLNFKRPQFSLDMSLYFLDYMEPGVAKRRLRARMLLLERLMKGLRQTIDNLGNKKSPSLAHILEHNLRMVETESVFLGNLVKELS
jgi:DNA-binding PadR family transcriptional regulator